MDKTDCLTLLCTCTGNKYVHQQVVDILQLPGVWFDTYSIIIGVIHIT